MAGTGMAALSGLRVVEVASGPAAAYCGRLLADAGASVTQVSLEQGIGIARDQSETERLYEAYLSAGKVQRLSIDPSSIAGLCHDADIVVVGEDAQIDATFIGARIAVVRLSWFGSTGPYSDWKANDLIVEALTGMPHLNGAVEGPPVHGGDRQASLVGGITAYIAALAALASKTDDGPRSFDVNILEANLVLSEMDIHFVERDNGNPLKRHGVNRFSPNGPVGIYPCKGGWVGIIATTPDQWRSLCAALRMDDLAADVSLRTRELRFLRLDQVEGRMIEALADGTPEEWGAVGRRHRVPIVPVPNAEGILAHPIFGERKSLATLSDRNKSYRLPRTPFGLTATPTASELQEPSAAPEVEVPAAQPKPAARQAPHAPLEGLVIADFTMGWAGPLAARMLADLGAEVLKIEAGRYPDWWRGVNWTPEYLASRQYENAKGFCALNRGKYGVSLDLTNEDGRALVLRMVANADAVVENQAAGVMDKLSLGYAELRSINPPLVMVSMSAFGTGNAWSDTRAYGSTLEQGSGLPSFTGFPGTAPTMAHLAYGDPVGGLFGCAALLTALVAKKRTGQGQYVNLSMIEAMLQFTTPALIEYQVHEREPLRRGNRHAAMSPHNIYPCRDADRWIAISVESSQALDALFRVIGRPELVGASQFKTLESRRAHEDDIDKAIEAWTRLQDPAAAARQLQNAGVCAAPVLHTDQLIHDEHLTESGFFVDIEREFSGPQRQCGVAIQQSGVRLVSRRPAPLLGQHSWDVLHAKASLSREAYDDLLSSGVVSFAPTALRSMVAST